MAKHPPLNHDFLNELSALVQKYYSAGLMRPDDVAIYFGLTVSAALANLPDDKRRAAGKMMADMIENPPVAGSFVRLQ